MSSKTMKVALAGAGAFGIKHLEAIAEDRRRARWSRSIGRTLERRRRSPRKFGIGHVTTDLAESLARPESTR